MTVLQASNTKFADKFVVISAARTYLTQEANYERHEALADAIIALGLNPIDAQGKWEGVSENSFIVECPTADDITQVHKLSLQFEQDAILYVNKGQAKLLYPSGELVSVGTWTAVDPDVAHEAPGYTLCQGQAYITK